MKTVTDIYVLRHYVIINKQVTLHIVHYFVKLISCGTFSTIHNTTLLHLWCLIKKKQTNQITLSLMKIAFYFIVWRKIMLCQGTRLSLDCLQLKFKCRVHKFSLMVLSVVWIICVIVDGCCMYVISEFICSCFGCLFRLFFHFGVL